MSADSLVLDFIHDLDNQGCPDAVSRSFQALIEKFGFTYFCIGSIKPHRDERGMVWATSLEHPWFKHWVESGRIHIDPVVWRMKRDGSPFRWESLREQPEVPHAEVIDEAAAFGIRDGWGMAFRLAELGAPAIAVGLGTSRYELSDEAWAPLHLASIYCGLKFAEFERRRTVVNPVLSRREHECLQWVAAGKTDWDISEILGISQQTAHKHVSNALRKLGAFTRAHAVAIAFSAGVLSP